MFLIGKDTTDTLWKVGDTYEVENSLRPSCEQLKLLFRNVSTPSPFLAAGA